MPRDTWTPYDNPKTLFERLTFPSLKVAYEYGSRAGRKGKRLEDFFKAREYLNWLIEDAEKERDVNS